MPFGLHLPELIIVLAVALLIFGPKKLPEMGSAIGRSIKEFKKGVAEIKAPVEDATSSSLTTTHIQDEAVHKND
jgi:sec-independent protein translocase protein TatA